VPEAIAHLEAAARELPQTDYVHYQLQAAYRKESRTVEADQEMKIYRELKAKNRASTVPRPVDSQRGRGCPFETEYPMSDYVVNAQLSEPLCPSCL